VSSSFGGRRHDRPRLWRYVGLFSPPVWPRSHGTVREALTCALRQYRAPLQGIASRWGTPSETKPTAAVVASFNNHHMFIQSLGVGGRRKAAEEAYTDGQTALVSPFTSSPSLHVQVSRCMESLCVSSAALSIRSSTGFSTKKTSSEKTDTNMTPHSSNRGLDFIGSTKPDPAAKVQPIRVLTAWWSVGRSRTKADRAFMSCSKSLASDHRQDPCFRSHRSVYRDVEVAWSKQPLRPYVWDTTCLPWRTPAEYGSISRVIAFAGLRTTPLQPSSSLYPSPSSTSGPTIGVRR